MLVNVLPFSISEKNTLKPSFVDVLGIIVTAGAVLFGYPILALFSLSCQAVRALNPRLNSIIYWPVGLCVVLTTNFVSYWIMWFTGTLSLTNRWAIASWILQSLFFFCMVSFREYKPGISKLRSHAGVILLAIIPLLILIWASVRLYESPILSISGYLGGGDHAAHSQIVHRMLGWGPTPFGASPFDLNAYPNGLHYLIANLVALDTSHNNLYSLARVYMWASWFEWFQLVAFIQLFLVLVIGSYHKLTAFKALYANCALLFLFLMNNALFHLFWSGFTTSLGTAWVLLVIPVLFAVREQNYLTSPLTTLIWFGIVGYAQWIVYPPFIIPISVICLWPIVIKIFKLDKSKIEQRKIVSIIPFLSFALSVGITLTPYLIGGKSNSYVSALTVEGATFKPHFYTVILSVGMALIASSLVAKHESLNQLQNSFYMVATTYLSALVGFVLPLIFIVTRVSDFGVLNQPYYIQKMYWILIFVSLPIFFSTLLPFVEKAMAAWRIAAPQKYFLLLLIPLMPFTQGRSIESAKRHLNVYWFPLSFPIMTDELTQRSLAFVKADPLGSHVSNLALSSVSEVVMPVDLSLNADPVAVCLFATANDIETIFTNVGGRQILVDSGCSLSIQFFEDGKAR